MARRSLLALSAAMLLLPGGAALAQRQINGFTPPHEMTPEELAESKARSRMAVNSYSNQVTEQVAPVPWLSVAILGGFLLLAAPYALRYYRDTARGAIRGRSAPAAEPKAAADRADQTRVLAAASDELKPPPRRPSKS